MKPSGESFQREILSSKVGFAMVFIDGEARNYNERLMASSPQCCSKSKIPKTEMIQWMSQGIQKKTVDVWVNRILLIPKFQPFQWIYTIVPFLLADWCTEKWPIQCVQISILNCHAYSYILWLLCKLLKKKCVPFCPLNPVQTESLHDQQWQVLLRY